MADITTLISEQLDIFNPYRAYVYRIVETQEYAATTRLVGTLEEQELLENLLDDVKPPYRKDTEQLHYLISTPFRYPPLKYGSRFGDITMPSYFYASEQVNVALAECAFYRFIFINDLITPYQKPVDSAHMSFKVLAKTDTAADLTKIKNQEIIQKLVSPTDYSVTQQVGRQLIEQGVKAIRFHSAREKNGINIAIAEPNVIKSSAPTNCINWMCKTTNQLVSFNAPHTKPISFSISQFLIDGKLPVLA